MPSFPAGADVKTVKRGISMAEEHEVEGLLKAEGKNERPFFGEASAEEQNADLIRLHFADLVKLLSLGCESPEPEVCRVSL